MLRKSISGIVQKIAEQCASRGNMILLPKGDEKAMGQIEQSFQALADTGIPPDFITNICTEKPDLFSTMTKNGKNFVKTLKAIHGVTEMSPERTLEFMAEWANEMAKINAGSAEARFRVFTGRGVDTGKQLREIIERCPFVLFDSTPQLMDQTLEGISSFFTNRDVRQLCIVSPHICLHSLDDLEKKYEYIYYHMGIEPGEFIDSSQWSELELDEIMMRADLLKKTGKYVVPDAKRPQLKTANPAMYEIFDTDDDTFPSVAGISNEEWFFFKQLYEKLKGQEDLEEPYQKIKPNMRKMVERKQKRIQEAREGEILDYGY